jgi:hypothetical protein
MHFIKDTPYIDLFLYKKLKDLFENFYLFGTEEQNVLLADFKSQNTVVLSVKCNKNQLDWILEDLREFTASQGYSYPDGLYFKLRLDLKDFKNTLGTWKLNAEQNFQQRGLNFIPETILNEN